MTPSGLWEVCQGGVLKIQRVIRSGRRGMRFVDWLGKYVSAKKRITAKTTIILAAYAVMETQFFRLILSIGVFFREILTDIIFWNN